MGKQAPTLRFVEGVRSCVPIITPPVLLVVLLAFGSTTPAKAESGVWDDGRLGKKYNYLAPRWRPPHQTRRSYRPRQYPALMSGGPRPQIAPRAPQIATFPNGERPGTVVIVNRWCKLYYTLSPT